MKLSGLSSVLLEMQPVQDVLCIRTLFANAYAVGNRDSWVLIDSLLPNRAGRICRAVETHFGADTRPRAIILTHAHWDHAGSAAALAAFWSVPIYVHPLEMPYATGKSNYAPPDPTIGGPLGLMVRFFPRHRCDLSPFVRPLAEGEPPPGMPHWRCLHTPGHTHGHISLFRESDRTLIAGDALATMDMHSFTGLMTRKPQFCGPPAPFTPDWNLADSSLHALAGLGPSAVLAGHGEPIVGCGPDALHQFADRFQPPRKGRYVAVPARADSRGIMMLPPPVPDPLPKVAAAVALGFAAALWFAKRSRAARRVRTE